MLVKYSGLQGRQNTPKNLLSEVPLTHWGRVMHICIGNLTIIGSDNGLSPGRRQAIIWNNAGLLLIKHLGTNVSEIWIGIQTYSLKKIHLNMSSAKWRPFCLGLNVLMWMGDFEIYLEGHLTIYIVGSHSSSVQYYIMYNKRLLWLCQKEPRSSFELPKTSHTSQVSYGVFVVGILEKTDHVIMVLHCTSQRDVQTSNVLITDHCSTCPCIAVWGREMQYASWLGGQT